MERVAGQLCCSTEAVLVGPLVQWQRSGLSMGLGALCALGEGSLSPPGVETEMSCPREICSSQ